MNKDKFFDEIKKSLLGPALSQTEVDGCNAILDACINWPMSHLSYALATAYHETAHSMKPIKEMGGPSYLTRMYDIKGNRPEMAKANGNTSPGDGIKYCGRGFVQLTWKSNYRKAETICKISGLLDNPDLAMTVVNAAKILSTGMSQGWFGGKSCKDYLPSMGLGSTDQFIKARKIINGVDKASLIAGYAIKFQDALN